MPFHRGSATAFASARWRRRNRRRLRWRGGRTSAERGCAEAQGGHSADASCRSRAVEMTLALGANGAHDAPISHEQPPRRTLRRPETLCQQCPHIPFCLHHQPALAKRSSTAGSLPAIPALTAPSPPRFRLGAMQEHASHRRQGSPVIPAVCCNLKPLGRDRTTAYAPSANQYRSGFWPDRHPARLAAIIRQETNLAHDRTQGKSHQGRHRR